MKFSGFCPLLFCFSAKHSTLHRNNLPEEFLGFWQWQLWQLHPQHFLGWLDMSSQLQDVVHIYLKHHCLDPDLDKFLWADGSCFPCPESFPSSLKRLCWKALLKVRRKGGGDFQRLVETPSINTWKEDPGSRFPQSFFCKCVSSIIKLWCCKTCNKGIGEREVCTKLQKVNVTSGYPLTSGTVPEKRTSIMQSDTWPRCQPNGSLFGVFPHSSVAISPICWMEISFPEGFCVSLRMALNT